MDTAKLTLTRQALDAAKPASKPYRLWDTKVPGLFLRVQPSGARTWNAQWSRSNSRSLGKYPVVTLEAARARALVILADAASNGIPEIAKPRTKVETFGDFIENHYAPWVKVENKAGLATIANLKAQFGFLYSKPIGEITAKQIDDFKTARATKGIKPATVNRDLDRIRAALSKAVQWEFIEINVALGIKRPKKPKCGGTRVRYLSAAEEKSLRAALLAREQTRREQRASGIAWSQQRGRVLRTQWAADQFTDHLMPLVLLALNTGLRRGELFGLDWSNVQLSEKRLTVVAATAKDGEDRHIPLNSEAVGVLTRWKSRGDGAGLVFPGDEGARLTNINRSWAKLLSKAKLGNFRFHDCRHHFASQLVMAGVDLNTVRELLGHADIAMTLRYAHLAPEHKAAAVEKLAQRRSAAVV